MCSITIEISLKWLLGEYFVQFNMAVPFATRFIFFKSPQKWQWNALLLHHWCYEDAGIPLWPPGEPGTHWPCKLEALWEEDRLISQLAPAGAQSFNNLIRGLWHGQNESLKPSACTCSQGSSRECDVLCWQALRQSSSSTQSSLPNKSHHFQSPVSDMPVFAFPTSFRRGEKKKKKRSGEHGKEEMCVFLLCNIVLVSQVQKFLKDCGFAMGELLVVSVVWTSRVCCLLCYFLSRSSPS